MFDCIDRMLGEQRRYEPRAAGEPWLAPPARPLLSASERRFLLQLLVIESTAGWLPLLVVLVWSPGLCSDCPGMELAMATFAVVRIFLYNATAVCLLATDGRARRPGLGVLGAAAMVAVTLAGNLGWWFMPSLADCSQAALVGALQHLWLAYYTLSLVEMLLSGVLGMLLLMRIDRDETLRAARLLQLQVLRLGYQNGGDQGRAEGVVVVMAGGNPPPAGADDADEAAAEPGAAAGASEAVSGALG